MQFLRTLLPFPIFEAEFNATLSIYHVFFAFQIKESRECSELVKKLVKQNETEGSSSRRLTKVRKKINLAETEMHIYLFVFPTSIYYEAHD